MQFTLRDSDNDYIIIDTVLDRSSGWCSSLEHASQKFNTTNRKYSTNWHTPITSSYDEFFELYNSRGYKIIDYIPDEPLAYEFW